MNGYLFFDWLKMYQLYKKKDNGWGEKMITPEKINARGYLLKSRSVTA